jgi:uncharacterized protein DUF4375
MAIDVAEMNRRLLMLAESPTARFWRVEFDALSVPESVFRAVWELEAEVNNGGFHQYFFNSSGKLARFALSALRAVGASQTAGILELAISVIGTDVQWSNDAARQERLVALPDEAVEELDDLDHAFFGDPDNLTALLYNYVCAHRAEFGASREF